jgi:hypothetical protein
MSPIAAVVGLGKTVWLAKPPKNVDKGSGQPNEKNAPLKVDAFCLLTS